MSDLNEDAIEQNLIELLKAQGYYYFHASELERDGFDTVVLERQFKNCLKKLNPDLPESARVETFQHVTHLGSSDIMTNNERFHQMLTDGVTVEYFKRGETIGLQVKLIDFDKPENNQFWVVNQFVIKENNRSKRLDVVLFVNGLPLVVIELKNAVSEKATLERAYTQIQNYKEAIPSLFYYNALCIISDGLDARTSSVSAPYSRYLAWKSPHKKDNGILPELQILARRMLQKSDLLKLIRFNTVFESEEVKDEKTGLLSLVKIKKIAAYHQYYLVEKAIQSTLRALNRNEQEVAEDPDDQLFTTFGNCASLLRQKPVQASSRENLKELLRVMGGGIVFTTIQKFYPENGNTTFATLSQRSNIVVVADEAHRGQYGATVPLSYESRLVKIKFNQEVGDKVDQLIEGIEGASEEQLEKAKKKNAQINAIVGHPERLKDIARDMVSHFEARQAVFEGKGMIVCMTRQIAVDLYAQIKQLKPDWHHDDLGKGTIKVVMTSASDDPSSFQPHLTNKKDRQFLAVRLKDSFDELKLVIVQSMWLTGFDAPPLHTLYIDKKMRGAALMQAIARVNRVYKDKPGGLIVDYIGIGQDLRSAMRDYTASGGQGSVAPELSEIISAMKAKFEVVKQMFLSGISSLSKLYVMTVPSEESELIKDQIAFFQAIKSRINKFTPSGGKTDFQVNTAIRQIVDDALSSDGVVDIFEAAGVSSPSLSILSEEFLLEVKNMEHENLAFELLKKLLNEEVKVRKSKNTIQGKKFSEMLALTIKRYHNNQIDTAQVIKELSEIAREMKLEDHKADELGLTPEEYAFYSILSQNSSTRYLENNKMKELIHLIVDIIRKNATVDWDKRADVKAKLRLLVKKVLMKYGYPPDVARIEADRVLEQSELLASELTC